MDEYKYDSDDYESENSTIWDSLEQENIGIWIPKFKLKKVKYKNENIIEIGTFSSSLETVET